MPYAWGSRTAIAELRGERSPSNEPQAEMWMGAHPMAPAVVTSDGSELSLETLIERAPERELGDRSLRAFGPRLPFLMKVLAAAEPLSLQAHPTEAQARAGFEREEKRGTPRDAPNRNYRDAHHKPELICALTPFSALSGFRPPEQTLALFETLAVSALDEPLAHLRSALDAKGLAAMFRAIMTMPEERRAPVVDATVKACAGLGDEFAQERFWTQKLATIHPGDVGIVSALMLHVVKLAPGEAMYLGAGNLHAYLEGVGIEIMASSDNVLRGGLTKKHVDVPELMRVLDFDGVGATRVAPREEDGHERVYRTEAREFELSRFSMLTTTRVARTVAGPEILLTTDGSITLVTDKGAHASVLARGSAAFLGADTGEYALEGKGTVFRAKVPA